MAFELGFVDLGQAWLMAAGLIHVSLVSWWLSYGWPQPGWLVSAPHGLILQWFSPGLFMAWQGPRKRAEAARPLYVSLPLCPVIQSNVSRGSPQSGSGEVDATSLQELWLFL